MAKAPAKKTPAPKAAPKPAAETKAVVQAAPQRPLTQPEQRKANMAKMLNGVMSSKEDLERFLTAQDIPFERFYAGLQVALMNTLKQDEDFFLKVTGTSFITAVFKAANDGLICDGREAVIARFGDEATYMPMVGGFVKKAHQTGMIASITTGVVTEKEDAEGRFEYIEGDDGYIKHRPSLTRTDRDPIVAAYAIVKTTNGGTYREVVPKADLEKMAAMSKARNGPRQAWALEMHRKGALRRVFKLIPNDKALAQLLRHDEETYLPAPRGGEEDPAKRVDNTALFAPKAQHKADPEKTDAPADQQEAVDETPIVEEVKTVKTRKAKAPAPAKPDAAPNQGPIVDEMVKTITDAKHLGELASAIHELSEHPKAGELTKASRDIVNKAAIARKAELMPKDVEDKRPLECIMRTGGSPKRFESPDVWRDDILQKMGALNAADAKAFWARNHTFFYAAREDGYPQAARIFEVAERKGLL